MNMQPAISHTIGKGYIRNGWSRAATLAILAVVLLLSTSCSSGSEIGPRPARNLDTVVEAYLQRYQPGKLPRLFQTTYMYDRNGQLIAEFFPEGRRTWVPIDQISPYLVEATIATEDATFYNNTGIDPRRVVGAFLQNAEAGDVVSGASTITMQLARNLFLGPDKRYDETIDRKILEVGLAQELNRLYTKNEILEMYLNLLNYGNLAYGPEAAAQVYFGKSAADLTLAEATLLAGIPQQPANYNPFDNFEAVRQRQRVVLALMARHNYLTEEEARAVHAQQFALRNHFAVRENTSYRPVNLTPHFSQYVVSQLDRQLGTGYTVRAGFHIFTTLDLEMQEVAQRVVSEQVATLGSRYGLSNAALLAMKPGTAEIMAMVGSADYYNESIAGQVNVTLRPRQPGSSIKPVFYALAMDQNLISPATVIWDLPVEYPINETQTYQPRNYDNSYHGPVTVRRALANSYNVPIVKLFDAAGIDTMLSGAREMGLSSLDREDTFYGLSMALGTGEVSLLELSSAFNVLASAGEYTSPRSVLNLLDSRGNTLNLLSFAEPRQILSPQTAFLLTDILSDNEARQEEFGPNSLLVLDRPAAAKTGTTTDFRDSWTMGYTKYLVAGVWSGNSDGRPTNGSSGIGGAAPIWNAFMDAVLTTPSLLNKLDAPLTAESWDFEAPPGVSRVPIECPQGVQCPAEGEYFSDSWLRNDIHNDPLYDSAATGDLLNVYAESNGESRWVGYCIAPAQDGRTSPALASTTGPQRSLLSIPQGVGLMPFANGATELSTSQRRLTDWEVQLIETTQERLEKERDEALAWGRRNGVQLSFGYCDQAEANVRQLLGTDVDRITVDGGVQIAQAIPPAPVEEAPTEVEPSNAEGDEAVAENAAAEDAGPGSTNAPAVGEVTYAVSAVWNDNSCAGNYVMGQVLSREGGPVAGIRVSAVDQWGNRAEASSKDGSSDFGRFDFPLYNGNPHEIYVNIVDAAGNPLSPTVTVRHGTGEDASATCHHIVFEGV